MEPGPNKIIVRKKHPLAIRWFHWLNFPILFCMIWSGLLIYWANDEYKIVLGKKTLVHFFPDSFYKALGIPYRLAEGMNWHFAFMWLFLVNGLLYVIFTFVSGQWRYLLPEKNSFKEAWLVLLHDLHIRRKQPEFIKYNAAQRVAYTAIIVMGFGSVVTGLAIYKPVQFGWITWLCGGYKAARLEHFLLTIGYVLFFLIHIVQVIKSGWNNFQAMVTGFELNKLPKTKKDEKSPDQLPEKVFSKKQFRYKTILSFTALLMLFTVGVIGFSWIRKQPKDDGTPKPLRTVLNTNEKIFSGLFSKKKQVKEYPVSKAEKEVRVNGSAGMDGVIDTTVWRLKIVRSNGDTLSLTLADIKKLPKKDIVFDFKCIEGWSQVTHWGGVPFSTFVEAYHLESEKQMKYIGLVTPDKEYYVGIDMPSALQEQTILCYEMNGEPLPMNQGYPLRLIIPVKYGIKHLKRIGTLFFSNKKPADYWAERGYDYYAGH